MTTTQPDSLLPARIVRFRDLAQRPWRNGGGLTRDIAARSDGRGITWRVSVADVDAPGDFSAFPGLDRILVMCRGTGMRVTVDGTEHLLQPWDVIRFSGDSDTRATLLDGPTVDLNVMTRRESARAAVVLTSIDGTVSVHAHGSETTLLVVVEGHLRCRGDRMVETRLRRFDTILLTTSSEPVDLVGSGRVVRIDLDLVP